MEANRKIQRIPHEGAVAGVCAGLGEYFGVDKTWIRVGFIFTIFFAGSGIGFIGPLLYIVLWVVLPVKPLGWSDDPFHVDYKVPPATNGDAAFSTSYGVPGTSSRVHPVASKKRASNSDKTTAGIILLGIGVFFLLHQFDFFHWQDMIRYWPVLLIFMGLVNIVTAFTGRSRPFENDAPDASSQPDETARAADEVPFAAGSDGVAGDQDEPQNA